MSLYSCLLIGIFSYLVTSLTVVRTNSSAVPDDLIERYRLVVPVHTTYIVDFISDATGIQLLGEINLEVRFIGEVAVSVQMDSLVAVAIIHGDEVMAENTSACRSVFQRNADVIVVLDCGECVLCFGVTEEPVVIALDQNNLTVQAIDDVQCFIIFCFPDHVAEDINEISSVDLRIPSSDQFCIHHIDRHKWAVVKADDIFVSEVEIAGKVYFTQWIIFFLV